MNLNYLAKVKSQSQDGRVNEPEAFYGDLGSRLTIKDHCPDHIESEDEEIKKPKMYYGRIVPRLTNNN